MSQQLEAKPQSDDNEEIKFFVNGEEEIGLFPENSGSQNSCTHRAGDTHASGIYSYGGLRTYPGR